MEKWLLESGIKHESLKSEWDNEMFSTLIDDIDAEKALSSSININMFRLETGILLITIHALPNK